MDQRIVSLFEDLEGDDKDKQYVAFGGIITEINTEVDWAYEVLEKLKMWLTGKDNHRRSRKKWFSDGSFH